MNDLNRKQCEACRVGAPLVTQAEIDEFMPQIPEWEIIEIDGINRFFSKKRHIHHNKHSSHFLN